MECLNIIQESLFLWLIVVLGFHAVDQDHVGKPDHVADAAVVAVQEVPVVVGVVALEDEEDPTLAAGRSCCVNTNRLYFELSYQFMVKG